MKNISLVGNEMHSSYFLTSYAFHFAAYSKRLNPSCNPEQHMLLTTSNNKQHVTSLVPNNKVLHNTYKTTKQ